jgi:glycerophosphoryl diester phosphodiesterase
MTIFGKRDPVARVRRMLGGTRTPPAGPARPLRVIGHRGAARHLPENTITAFDAAIALGADAIETDVCVTADDELVLWHDNDPGDGVSLARGVGVEDFEFVANWPGVLKAQRQPVHEMTLAEMRRRCGYSRHQGIFSGDEPPEVPFILLSDGLSWAASEPRLGELFLDVKLHPEHAERARLLLAAVDGARIPITLLLPHRELYEALRGERLRPGVTLMPDFELPGALDECAALGARQVSMGYTKRRTWGDFERELAVVIAARDQGELDRVLVWTVNDIARLRALVAARVDAIITDEPAALRELIDR